MSFKLSTQKASLDSSLLEFFSILRLKLSNPVSAPIFNTCDLNIIEWWKLIFVNQVIWVTSYFLLWVWVYTVLCYFLHLRNQMSYLVETLPFLYKNVISSCYTSCLDPKEQRSAYSSYRYRKDRPPCLWGWLNWAPQIGTWGSGSTCLLPIQSFLLCLSFCLKKEGTEEEVWRSGVWWTWMSETV